LKGTAEKEKERALSFQAHFSHFYLIVAKQTQSSTSNPSISNPLASKPIANRYRILIGTAGV